MFGPCRRTIILATIPSGSRLGWLRPGRSRRGPGGKPETRRGTWRTFPSGVPPRMPPLPRLGMQGCSTRRQRSRRQIFPFSSVCYSLGILLLFYDHAVSLNEATLYRGCWLVPPEPLWVGKVVPALSSPLPHCVGVGTSPSHYVGERLTRRKTGQGRPPADPGWPSIRVLLGSSSPRLSR